MTDAQSIINQANALLKDILVTSSEEDGAQATAAPLTIKELYAALQLILDDFSDSNEDEEPTRLSPQERRKVLEELGLSNYHLSDSEDEVAPPAPAAVSSFNDDRAPTARRASKYTKVVEDGDGKRRPADMGKLQEFEDDLDSKFADFALSDVGSPKLVSSPSMRAGTPGSDSKRDSPAAPAADEGDLRKRAVKFAMDEKEKDRIEREDSANPAAPPPPVAEPKEGDEQSSDEDLDDETALEWEDTFQLCKEAIGTSDAPLAETFEEGDMDDALMRARAEEKSVSQMLQSGIDSPTAGPQTARSLNSADDASLTATVLRFSVLERLHHELSAQARRLGLLTCIAVAPSLSCRYVLGCERGLVIVFPDGKERKDKMVILGQENTYPSVNCVQVHTDRETKTDFILAGYASGMVILYVKHLGYHKELDYSCVSVMTAHFLSGTDVFISVDVIGNISYYKGKYKESSFVGVKKGSYDCNSNGKLDVASPAGRLVARCVAVQHGQSLLQDANSPFIDIRTVSLIALADDKYVKVLAFKPSQCQPFADALLERQDFPQEGQACMATIPCVEFRDPAQHSDIQNPLLIVAWQNSILVLDLWMSGDSLKTTKMYKAILNDSVQRICVLPNSILGCIVVPKFEIHNIIVIDPVKQQVVERQDVSYIDVVSLTSAGKDAVPSIQHSIASLDGSVHILGHQRLVNINLLTWEERLDVLCTSSRWEAALKLAKEFYNGVAPATVNLPSADRHQMVRGRAMDIMLRLLDFKIQELQSMERGAASVAVFHGCQRMSGTLQEYHKLTSMIVENCMAMGAIDLLFKHVYEKYVAIQQSWVFIQLLEHNILNRKIQYLTDQLLDAVVQCYTSSHYTTFRKEFSHLRGAVRPLELLEQMFLCFDAKKTNFDKVLQYALQHNMFQALLCVFNKCVLDYIEPLGVLLSIVTKNVAEAAASAGSRMVELGDDDDDDDIIDTGHPLARTAAVLATEAGEALLNYMKGLLKGVSSVGQTIPHDQQRQVKIGVLEFLFKAQGEEGAPDLAHANEPYPSLRVLIDINTAMLLDLFAEAFRDNSMYSPWTENARNEENRGFSKKDAVQIIFSVFADLSEDAIWTPHRSAKMRWPTWAQQVEMYKFFCALLAEGTVKGRADVVHRIVSHLSYDVQPGPGPLGRCRQQNIVDMLKRFHKEKLEYRQMLDLCNKAKFTSVRVYINHRDLNFAASVKAYIEEEDVELAKKVFDYLREVQIQLDSHNKKHVIAPLAKDAPDGAPPSKGDHDCHEQELAPTANKNCAKCGKAAAGKCLYIMGKVYHRECFACGFCHHPINANETLALAEGADEPRYHEKCLGEMENEVKKALYDNACKLAEMDNQLLAKLVVDFFFGEHHEILSSMHANPRSKYLYLQGLVQLGNEGKGATLDDGGALSGPTRDEMKKIRQLLGEKNFQMMYIECLCQFDPPGVHQYLLHNENYDVPRSLELCQQYQVKQATAYLLERKGDKLRALNLLLQEVVPCMSTLRDLFYKSIQAKIAMENTPVAVMGGRARRQSMRQSIALPKEEDDRLKDIEELLAKPEYEALKKEVNVAIELCVKNSQGAKESDADHSTGGLKLVAKSEASQLWFALLDFWVLPKKLLADIEVAHKARLAKGEIAALDTGFDELDLCFKWSVDANEVLRTRQRKGRKETDKQEEDPDEDPKQAIITKKRNEFVAAVKGALPPVQARVVHALQEFYTEMISYTLKNMLGNLKLQEILSKIVKDHGSETFGQFKSVLLGILDIFSYENNLYQSFLKLLQRDSFKQAVSLTNVKSSAIFSTQICQTCKQLISESADSDVINMFSCGHMFHSRCTDFTSCKLCSNIDRKKKERKRREDADGTIGSAKSRECARWYEKAKSQLNPTVVKMTTLANITRERNAFAGQNVILLNPHIDDICATFKYQGFPYLEEGDEEEADMTCLDRIRTFQRTPGTYSSGTAKFDKEWLNMMDEKFMNFDDVFEYM